MTLRDAHKHKCPRQNSNLRLQGTVRYLSGLSLVQSVSEQLAHRTWRNTNKRVFHGCQPL